MKIIYKIIKMKEEENDYFYYFNDNDMFEVSLKIFNDNCVEGS